MSVCSTEGSQLTIDLIGQVSFQPGVDTLALAPGQSFLVASGADTPFAGALSAPVASCGAACPAPEAILQVWLSVPCSWGNRSGAGSSVRVHCLYEQRSGVPNTHECNPSTWIISVTNRPATLVTEVHTPCKVHEHSQYGE